MSSLRVIVPVPALSRLKPSGFECVTLCNCPRNPELYHFAMQKNSVAVLGLAHIAQSFVVVIVGLNLGFRFETALCVIQIAANYPS